MRKLFALMLNKRSLHSTPLKFWNVQKYPELDFQYLCNQNNAEEITQNINRRKGVGNIQLVQKLKQELNNLSTADVKYESVKNRFYSECKNIPNETHPDVANYGEHPRVIKLVGAPRQFDFKPLEFHDIAKKLKLIRTEQLGHLSGHRSYYLLGELAELEHTLIQYTLSNLLRKGFKLVTVPDVLHRDVIEACGLNTRGERTQVQF